VLFTPHTQFFCDNGQNRRTLVFFMGGKVILGSIFLSSGKSGGDRFRCRHEKRPDFLFTGCHPHTIAKKSYAITPESIAHRGW